MEFRGFRAYRIINQIVIEISPWGRHALQDNTRTERSKSVEFTNVVNNRSANCNIGNEAYASLY